jgi:hypothetical protein
VVTEFFQIANGLYNRWKKNSTQQNNLEGPKVHMNKVSKISTIFSNIFCETISKMSVEVYRGDNSDLPDCDRHFKLTFNWYHRPWQTF